MSKRSVELSIELKNAKSIGDLEKVLKDINTELKAVDVNSDAFLELSNSAKKADGSLKDIKDDLKGISSEKQLDSVAKLGGSLAAGLSVASIAASKFGDESKEGITKAIQTATELSVVVGSIKPLLEGLSSSNRKAFGQFVDGFKSAGVGAKLFGTTTRTAVASTGIGLLVIALGLLIANWDSVTKSVKEFGESIPFIKAIVDGVQSLIDKVGSLSNLFSGIGAFIKGVFTAGTSAVDEFNKAIEKGKAIDALKAQAEAIELQNEGRERTLKLLQAQGGKELEILAIQKEQTKQQLANLEARQKAGDELSKDELKKIEDLKNELDLIDIRTKKTLESQAKTAKDLSDKRKKEVDDKAKSSKEELDKYIQDINARRAIGKKAEEDAIRDISQLKINAISDDSKRQIEQLKFDYANKIKALTGTEKQITEQRTLLETERQRKIADIAVKGLKDQLDRTKALQSEADEQKKEADALKLEEFKAQIDTINTYAQLGSQGINDIAGAITDSLSRDLVGIQSQLDSTNQLYAQSAAERQALETELADSDGARREQILNSIDQEKKKQLDLANQQKKLTQEKNKALNKQQEIEWANSLLNAVVQGALSVIEALPNVPLSVAVGIIAGIETAIIAGNKPTPIPLAKGGPVFEGFTGIGGARDETGERVAFETRLHGDEWVAPRWMVKDPVLGTQIQHLEGIRKASLAVGGSPSSAPIISSDIQSGSLSAESLRSIMENAQIFVSAKEVGDLYNNNVKTIESRAAA